MYDIHVRVFVWDYLKSWLKVLGYFCGCLESWYVGQEYPCVAYSVINFFIPYTKMVITELYYNNTYTVSLNSGYIGSY